MTQAFYSVQKALQLEPENKMAIDMREELNRQAMTAKEQVCKSVCVRVCARAHTRVCVCVCVCVSK